MKYLAASIWMLVSILPCAADDATKAQKIEEMLRLTKADKMVDQVFDQMNKVVLAQLNSIGGPSEQDEEKRKMAAEVQTQMMEVLRRYMSWDKMKPQYVRIYAESFTEEEVTGMVEFYKTPAGRSMLEKLPLVMAKSMEIVQPIMKDMMPEIQRIVEATAKKNGVK